MHEWLRMFMWNGIGPFLNHLMKYALSETLYMYTYMCTWLSASASNYIEPSLQFTFALCYYSRCHLHSRYFQYMHVHSALNLLGSRIYECVRMEWSIS